MLFTYEMKKIWRRVSPWLVLIILALTTIATMIITAIFFSQSPNTYPDVSAQYAALETKINNWDTSFNRSEFATAFDRFYEDYKDMNAHTLYGLNELVGKYNKAKLSFNGFYIDYYNHPTYGIKQNVNNYLLVNRKYIEEFDQILLKLNNFFDQNYTSNNLIINGLKTSNAAWEDASLENILENLFFVQKVNAEDLNELKAFFVVHPSNIQQNNYTNEYDYALNRFWLAVAKASKYKGELSQYAGFDDFQNVATSTQACQLAQYRLDHADEDFASPFEFGNIYNNSDQVSLFDYVFTNLEMAMIPITLLVMIWAACVFFTDNDRNTLITPVAAGKKRFSIILTKMSVVLILTIFALLIITGIYVTGALLFFHAYISPDVLFLFNGTQPMTLSVINYFILYFLNLIFKLLPLIAICGLFSFIKTKPFVIVGLTTLIYTLTILANYFLGGFNFYQFIPLMGLDPIRYFGAKLLFAPMPDTYNILYTVPAIAGITILLYGVLIHIFRHHDF